MWAEEVCRDKAPLSLSRLSPTVVSLRINCDLPKAGQLLQLVSSIPNTAALQELHLYDLLPRETEGLIGVVQQLGASVRRLRLEAYARPPYTRPWPQAAQWKTLFHHLPNLEILEEFLPGNTCYEDPSVSPPTIKHLRLATGSYIGSFRLLEALGDPAFLPHLREVPKNLSSNREDGLGVRHIGVTGAQELHVLARACRALHARSIDLKPNREEMSIALDCLVGEVDEEIEDLEEEIEDFD